MSDLKNAFKKYAIYNSYLNISSFNKTISEVLKFNIPIIAESYLSNRLYELLDNVYFYLNA